MSKIMIDNSSRFVAFDVETPNRRNDRMSAIGMTVIEGGEIREEYYSIIDPKQEFELFNSELTNIYPEDVVGKPDFKTAWPVLEYVFRDSVLVAHNARFDLFVLRKCIDDYGIIWRRSVNFICTVQTGRILLPGMSHKLNDMCSYYGIMLDHHHAGSDSRGCAEILLRYMRDGADIKRFVREYVF